MNCKNLDAFIILSNLFCVSIIRAAFNSSVEHLKAYGVVFSNLLNDHAPKIYKHLAKCNYPLETYIFDSAASLFANNFPPAVAVKIWDVVLENPELGIMRVGLSVFKSLEKLILLKRQDEIMMLVKYPCQNVDEDTILRMLAKTVLKPKEYEIMKDKTLRQVGIKQPILI